MNTYIATVSNVLNWKAYQPVVHKNLIKIKFSFLNAYKTFYLCFNDMIISIISIVERLHVVSVIKMCHEYVKWKSSLLTVLHSKTCLRLSVTFKIYIRISIQHRVCKSLTFRLTNVGGFSSVSSVSSPFQNLSDEYIWNRKNWIISIKNYATSFIFH